MHLFFKEAHRKEIPLDICFRFCLGLWIYGHTWLCLRLISGFVFRNHYWQGWEDPGD